MNDVEHSKTTGRRQWLTGVLRYTLLGGLTVLSGHLLHKSQRPECRSNVTCQRCRAWDSCRLPQAVESRLEKGDSHLLCKAPKGPSRQKVAVTFFQRRKTQG